MHQDIVGVHVQLLLDFALDVDVTLLTKDGGQPGSTNLRLNHLGRHREARQQPREFA